MSDRPQLDTLIAVAAQHPQWHWYAFADSAQDKTQPAAIAPAGADVRCLLERPRAARWPSNRRTWCA